MNACEFSPDRRHRYSLLHRWNNLFTTGERLVAWVGLNPSIADEQQLDPTLKRIEDYSDAWGFNGFVMLNLFGYRATIPRDMFAAAKGGVDPIGPDNDKTILEWAAKVEFIVCCWGRYGMWLNRCAHVQRMLAGFDLRQIFLLEGGIPGHPLYLKKGLQAEKLEPLAE